MTLRARWPRLGELTLSNWSKLPGIVRDEMELAPGNESGVTADEGLLFCTHEAVAVVVTAGSIESTIFDSRALDADDPAGTE